MEIRRRDATSLMTLSSSLRASPSILRDTSPSEASAPRQASPIKLPADSDGDICCTRSQSVNSPGLLELRIARDRGIFILRDQKVPATVLGLDKSRFRNSSTLRQCYSGGEPQRLIYRYIRRAGTERRCRLRPWRLLLLRLPSPLLRLPGQHIRHLRLRQPGQRVPRPRRTDLSPTPKERSRQRRNRGERSTRARRNSRNGSITSRMSPRRHPSVNC